MLVGVIIVVWVMNVFLVIGMKSVYIGGVRKLMFVVVFVVEISFLFFGFFCGKVVLILFMYFV